MASVEFDEASSRYRIRFRYGGKPLKRSLKLPKKREQSPSSVGWKRSSNSWNGGVSICPPDADIGVFILSDGKLNRKPTAEQGNTVQEPPYPLSKVTAERLQGTHHHKDRRNPCVSSAETLEGV